MSLVVGAMATMLTAEGGGSNPPLTAGIVMMMVAIVLGMITMQRRRSTRTPDLSSYVREQASRVRQQEGVREDMERIFVQISELSRELNAQMDTRFAKLEHAIAQADERIATLESLLRRAAGVQAVDVIVDDRPAGQPAARAPAQASDARISREAGTRRTGKKAAGSEKAEAKQDATAAAKEPASAQQQLTPPDPGELRYSRIYELADQGLPIVEIARQVGQTTGEVELILNLRKTRNR